MTESEATFRKMIERDPHHAPAHYELGLVLARDPMRLREAEASYRKAMELEPSAAQYVYRLGLLLHEELHRPDEAEAAYRRAIALAPEDPFFYGGLISLLVGQSRRAEALPFSEKMRALLGAAENWYGLATLDAILGNTAPALEYLRKAARETNFDSGWARNDPDLSSIRDDPRFEAVLGHM